MSAASHRLPLMDFRVSDLNLAEFGRKEINLAEHEMHDGYACEARRLQAAGRGKDWEPASHDGADCGRRTAGGIGR